MTRDDRARLVEIELRAADGQRRISAVVTVLNARVLHPSWRGPDVDAALADLAKAAAFDVAVASERLGLLRAS